jgi:hypothetical protein
MNFDPNLLKLGKLPANIPKNLKKMTEHFDRSLGLISLPPPPLVRTWSQNRPSWGDMLNDQSGDCTCAGIGHYFQVATLDESGNMVTSADSVVETLYENATGYRPGVPSTDNGAECSTILQYVTNNGFNGYKIYGYGLVDQANPEHCMEMIDEFGGMYIGLSLPKTAQTQVGEIWDVVDSSLQGDSAIGSWGGHCVFVPDYVSNGSQIETLTCITWGGLQKMTWNYFYSYCDEAYCLLSDAWLSKGNSPTGFNLASLEANMAELTHEN